MVVTFLVSMCVAVFAVAFSFAGFISVVIPDRRVRSLSAIVALVAAYVAFRSRPEEAMEIVKQPIEGVWDWFVRSLLESLPGTDPVE